MESDKSKEKRALIEKEAEYVVRYVRDFKVFSGKDEAAIDEILALLIKLHATVDQIEVSHQKRIILMKEMEKTISAMEEDHKSFASKHSSVASK